MAIATRALGRCSVVKFNRPRPFATAITAEWLRQYDNATSFLHKTSVPSPVLSSSPKHVLKMDDLSKSEVVNIMKVALEMKKSTKESLDTGIDRFGDAVKGRSLLTLFENPSLRTRISLEVGMFQMGGQPIFYSIKDSPLGQKESIEDTGVVLSRMCHGITARVSSRDAVRKLAKVCSIPVINALDDYGHPMQMLADLLTILEHKGTFEGITMTFVGDLENNVTYDLMRCAAVMGYNFNMAGVGEIEQSVWDECKTLQLISGSKITRFDTAEEAMKDVDVVYCDSWMSYGIPKAEEDARMKLFMPFQVNTKLMKLAKPDCVFMNCLPAARGMEQTADVIDGPQSIVFDQAENRLHAQKSLLVYCMNPQRFIEILPEKQSRSSANKEWVSSVNGLGPQPVLSVHSP